MLSHAPDLGLGERHVAIKGEITRSHRHSLGNSPPKGVAEAPKGHDHILGSHLDYRSQACKGFRAE